MNLQSLVCTLVMVATLVLAGCGGGGGGSGAMTGMLETQQPSAPQPPAPQPPAPQLPAPQLPVTTPGDDMMDSMPGDDMMTGIFASSLLTPAIASAAGNEPVVGSVTQSSDGNHDNVQVEVTNENGVLTYGVLYDGTSIVTTERGQVAENVELLSDQPKGTERWERVSGNDWNGIKFYRSLRAGEAEDGSVAGDLWVNVYTDLKTTASTAGSCGVDAIVAPGQTCSYDVGGNSFTFTVSENNNWICVAGGRCYSYTYDLYSNGFMAVPYIFAGWGITTVPDNAEPVQAGTQVVRGKDIDYLAWGLWVLTPDDATSLGEVGVFVDGNDPFASNHLRVLAGEAAKERINGTATYEGDATGIYSVMDDGIRFFDADATLMADFRLKSNGTLGTITGTIDNIRTYKELGDGDAQKVDATLNLGMTDIGGTNSGFFTGDTAMTVDGSEFTGKWGGQFFGNGVGVTTLPGSVAGTFGAATTSGDKSLLGAFGAHRPGAHLK